MMQSSYSGSSPTGTYTGQPNKAQVLDLIKSDKDLRNEFKTLISESIRNEFIRIRGEIVAAQQQAQIINAQQQQAASTSPKQAKKKPKPTLRLIPKSTKTSSTLPPPLPAPVDPFDFDPNLGPDFP